MDEKATERCRIFIFNTTEIRRAFRMDNGYTHPLCAWFFANSFKSVDLIGLKLGRTLIKTSTGTFSAFRTSSMPALSALLALESTPTSVFENVRINYAILRRQFRASSFLPITAYLAEKLRGERSAEDFSVRIGELLRLLRSKRPGILNGEDTCFAALLASSDRASEDISAEAQSCYYMLKKTFHGKNDILWQTAYILTLDPEPSEVKCEKLLAMCNALRKRRMKFGSGFELAAIYLIASITDNIEQTADTVEKINSRLRAERGFGVMFGAQQRFIYSLFVTFSSLYESSGISDERKKLAVLLSAIVAENYAEAAFMNTVL